MYEVGTSKAWLAEVVELAADAIICIDDNQNVLFCNRGAEEIFGYTSEEIVGRPLSILLPQPSRTVHIKHVKTFGSSPVTARYMHERSEVAAGAVARQEAGVRARAEFLGRDRPLAPDISAVRELVAAGWFTEALGAGEEIPLLAQTDL